MTADAAIATTPEATEALRRLSQIPPALVSSQLHSGVLEVAQLRARARKLHESRDVAQDAMRLALRAGNMPAAQVAAERLAGLERLIPELAAPESVMDLHQVPTAVQPRQEKRTRTRQAKTTADPSPHEEGFLF